MRNLVFLGLLALSLSFFANPLFAGDVSDCEGLRDDPNRALYGLCIAYFNTTNATARQKIADNFVKKGGDAAGWLGIGVIGPAQFVECTCWLQADHVEAVLGGSLSGESIADDPYEDFYQCNADGAGEEVVFFNNLAISFFADDSGCMFINSYDAADSQPFIEYGALGADPVEAELTCRAQIHELIQAYASDDCL